MNHPFSPKDPEEEVIRGWNFAPLLAQGETVVSATVTLERQDGVSEDTSAMLNGAADLSQKPIVRQAIKGGTDGVTYIIRFKATTSRPQVLVETPTQLVVRGGKA